MSAHFRNLLSPFALFLLLLFSSTSAQRPPQSQIKTLFRLQRILEYPSAFNGLNNYTNPCYLPPSPSLSIICSENRITELTIIGTAAPLSPRFNIDSFFTTLNALQNLNVLNLVSLGLWGPLPGKIDRFESLKTLNLSSNFLSGEIPFQISTMETLQTLVLSHNRFNGTTPDLRSLPLLIELNLTGNRLGPEFPLLPENIVSVGLKNNSVRAGIPPEIKSFNNLQILDVSSNQLIGPIPAFLFSNPSIRLLDLSRNLLSGVLPGKLSCSKTLSFIDVSGNRLSGRLPSCVTSVVGVRYDGNCLLSGDLKVQHPASYCSDGAIAAIMPKKGKGSQPNSRLGFIWGIIGGIGGAAFVLGLVMIFVVKKSNFKTGEAKPLAPAKSSDSRHLLQSARLNAACVGSFRNFSYDELEEATGKFSAENLSPESKSPAEVYNGRLEDGSNVVIKCLRLKLKYSPQSLTQFIESISKLGNRHVVSILGHSVSDDCQRVFLVFEVVSNGNLRTHMTEWRKREMLKWPQRAAAAMGIAKGIQFLHSVGISGNDLGIESILLDETLAAKISNYNLPVGIKNKSVKGGVECPFEGIEEGDVFGDGEKRDVYQLGLILLEIIIGSPVSNQLRVNATTNQLRDCLAEGSVMFSQVVDPSIQGTYAFDSLRAVAELAVSCVASDASQRPSIDDVIWNLQYAVQLQEGWANSQSGPLL